MTKTALQHHLNILTIATDATYNRLRSSHRLLSKYSHLKTQIEKIYVCKHKLCQKVLVTTNGIPNEVQPCGHKQLRQLNGQCYILRLPIEQQLVYFVTHHGLASPSEWNSVDPEIRSDVNSGGLYRDMCAQGLIDDSTITLQINTDGARCFKVLRTIIKLFSMDKIDTIINDSDFYRSASLVFGH